MGKAVVLLGALALGLVTSVGAAASPGTVAARGGESFVPNALIQSTFRFSPGQVDADSGQTLTWVDEDRAAEEPHTVTLVDEADLPTDVEEVFECQAPGEPCGDALEAHFGGGPVIDIGSPDSTSPVTHCCSSRTDPSAGRSRRQRDRPSSTFVPSIPGCRDRSSCGSRRRSGGRDGRRR
jgi:plastocyanin